MRRPIGKRRDRRGAAAVEFAIVAIPFHLLLFGALDFGRFVLAQHSLTRAARAGARLAATNTDVNSNDSNHMSESEIENTIRPLLSGQGLQDLQFEFVHVTDPTTDWVTHATHQHRIALDIAGNYIPMTPVFRLISGGTMSTFSVVARSIAYSEGH